MKITGMNLHTSLGIIPMGGSGKEATREDWEEITEVWSKILQEGEKLSFGIGQKAYIIPEAVLRNSFISVDFEGGMPE